MRIGTIFALGFGLVGPAVRAAMVLTEKDKNETVEPVNTSVRKETDYEQAE